MWRQSDSKDQMVEEILMNHLNKLTVTKLTLCNCHEVHWIPSWSTAIGWGIQTSFGKTKTTPTNPKSQEKHVAFGVSFPFLTLPIPSMGLVYLPTFLLLFMVNVGNQRVSSHRQEAFGPALQGVPVVDPFFVAWFCRCNDLKWAKIDWLSTKGG